MKGQLSLRPILLVHPDFGESSYLVTQLRAEGIARRIVNFPGLPEARDYLETVELAADDRFDPCAILLDEKLGEAAVRSFARWLRSIARFQSTRIVALANEEPAEARTWGTDATVSPAVALNALAGLLAKACR